MADENSVLWLLSSLIACLQFNLALFHLLSTQYRRRAALLRLEVFSNTSRRTFRPKTTRSRHRRFWTRTGRTSAWWGNFLSQVVLPQEWIENFRMSRSSVLKWSKELRPYIEGKATRMRQPVDVVKKVACTLYYLSDTIWCLNRSSMSAYWLWTDSQSTLSYVFDTLYSFVTVKRSSTSSSVQIKAIWTDVFLAFCRVFFDVAILKRTMCWGVSFTFRARGKLDRIRVFDRPHWYAPKRHENASVDADQSMPFYTYRNAFKQKRISVDMA